MKELKKKPSVRLSESAWDDVEHHYQADNCSTKNEYIKKAIQFYSGYLDTKHAEEYLPRILSDVLEGKLGAFEKRMGHLLFKQAVDQDVMVNLLASDINVDLDTLKKLWVRCVKNVKETNGEIDFQDAFRFQKRSAPPPRCVPLLWRATGDMSSAISSPTWETSRLERSPVRMSRSCTGNSRKISGRSSIRSMGTRRPTQPSAVSTGYFTGHGCDGAGKSHRPKPHQGHHTA